MRALWVVTVLWCAGCFDPDDILPLRGSVTSNRQSLAKHPVELRRSAKPAFFNDCADATAFKSTETDEGGGYGIELFRAQTQSLTGGRPFCFRAATRFESGVEAVADLFVVAGDVDLPALPDWDPQLELTTDGGTSWALHFQPVMDLPPMENDPGSSAAHRADLLSANGDTVWEAVAPTIDGDGGAIWPPGALTLSADVLEDFEGVLRLTGRASTSLAAGIDLDFGGRGLQFDMPVEVTVPTGQTLRGATPAFSRGATCAPFTSPCPLTDGLLAPVSLPEGATQTTIMLARPMMPRSVVIRGATFPSVPVISAVHEQGPDTQLSMFRLFGWPVKYPATEPQRGPQRTPQGVGRPLFIELALASQVSRPITGLRLTWETGPASLAEVSIFEQ